MSVGIGKIRVSRVADTNVKREVAPKSRPPRRAKPILSPSSTAGASANAAHVEAAPVQVEAIRVKHRLVLSQQQKAKLKNLFMAPRALAGLLRAYPQKLVTSSDVSMFLLSNRKELDGYINPDARGRIVDLLSELLLQWSGTPPDSVGIEFEEAFLTPDHKVRLPLVGFEGVEVIAPMQFMRQRQGRRLKAPLTLFEEGKHFFVALTLELKQTIAPSSQPTDKKAAKKKVVKVPREFQLEPGQSLPYVSSVSPRIAEPRQRVLYSKFSQVFSSGLRSMNWGGLSGWGINGGLPSLGKRSR